MIKNKLVEGYGFIGTDPNTIYKFGNGKYKTFEGTEIVAENCVKAKVKDLVVEGKTIQDTEDLSNIESVAEKEENKLIFTVTNNGKNLVDTATIYNDKLQSGNIGDTFNPNDSMTYDVYKIEVEPNFNYGFVLIGYGQSPYIRVFNNDNKITQLFSLEVTSELYTWTFTVNSNAKYIVFNKPKTSKGEFKIYKIDKFVENINLPIPLRSLPNGTCDTIEGNRLVQRVGRVVLENIKDYNIADQIKNNNRIGIMVGNVLGSSTRKPIISDYFFDLSNGGESVNGSFSYGGRIFLYLGLSTLEEYVEWFKGNPTTFYYSLSEPIIHDLEIPSISTVKGTNIITTTNNIKPNLKIKVKVKK